MSAVVSQSGSLTGSDEACGAVCRQYNVHRARSIDEFVDVGYACTAGRFPKGNRFGIVTVSGGVGILMADVAAARGLEVSRLPDPARRKIKARSEEHTSELQSLMRISYAVFCLKKKTHLMIHIVSTTIPVKSIQSK